MKNDLATCADGPQLAASHKSRGPDQTCTASAPTAVTQTGRLSTKTASTMERRGKGLSQRMAFGAHRATRVLVTKAKHQNLSSAALILCTSNSQRVCVFFLCFFFVSSCLCVALQLMTKTLALKNLNANCEGNLTPANQQKKKKKGGEFKGRMQRRSKRNPKEIFVCLC